MDPLNGQIAILELHYIRANRFWRSNNLKSCLLICDKLTKKLVQLQAMVQNQVANSDDSTTTDAIINGNQSNLVRLKNLVWYLKIRCLADDYYLNESLLLNDDDIDDEDNQVRLINHQKATTTATTTTAANITDHQSSAASTISRPLTAAVRPAITATGRKLVTTAGSRIERETRHRGTAAILTGKRSSLSSRQSSQGASSYRPLTTSLTATQTAFSRSTRPLLKYVTCSLLAKDLFEYLYNVQTITNKCPDYRQCLEYLNLLRKSMNCKSSTQSTNEATSIQTKRSTASSPGVNSEILLDLDSNISLEQTSSSKLSLGSFWLNSFGICYYNLRMNKEAEEYFSHSKELNPKHLDSYTWLVKVYLRTNQPNQVLRTCQSGLQQCRSSILYNWMARVQSLINNSYKANMSLKESLKFHPTNIEALANVGHFAFYADKPELSLKCFERIQQLSINQSVSLDSDYQTLASFSQLLNNMALSNFYCGYYHKVVPLFFKALLSSPNKEVTSDIWYNLSFVPLTCGSISLSINCLKLALRNDSQNIEALNNLGVLKYRSIVNDNNLHFANKQEYWGLTSQKLPSTTTTTTASKKGNYQLLIDNDDDDDDDDDDNHDNGRIADRKQQKKEMISLDEIQTFFKPPPAASDQEVNLATQFIDLQPEMLYNMAVIEKKRGQLLASMRYCQLYTQHDQNNYHIQNMMREIRQLVSHNG